MNIFKSVIIFTSILVASHGVWAQGNIGRFTVESLQSAPICTADAKLCPDGSSVGRSGPNCTFVCPGDASVLPGNKQCTDLKFNMYLRSTDSRTGGDVSRLQVFLSPEYFNRSSTGYFGSVTLASVQKFQRENNLLAFGYVGPVTRAKIKELTCNGGTVFGIRSIEPSVATVGATVTLYGTDLNTGNPYITMNGSRVEVNVSRANSGVLSFVVPESLTQLIQVIPGTYKIRVVNSNGVSNEVNLSIKNKDSDFIPKISFVEPESGMIGQTIGIYGFGLWNNNARVFFDGMGISSFPIYSERSGNFNSAISFTVPRELPPCTGTICTGVARRPVVPGATYNLEVRNSLGVDSKRFTVLTESENARIRITSLTPASGGRETEVIIRGSGINVGGDQIYFGNSLASRLTSASADTVNTLRFKVPAFYTPCGHEDNTGCSMTSRPVTDGTYEVRVKNRNGVSNALSFTVTSSTTNSPTISGVSGPQTLNVNQQGTWTVTASNPGGGNLSYSVVWGDEQLGVSTSGQTTQQTATFTRAYSRAGSFTPRFTVTNANGQSATASLSVNVGNTAVPVPAITSFSPASGSIGTRVIILGTNINTNEEVVTFGGSLNYVDIIQPRQQGRVEFIIPSGIGGSCPRFTTNPTCPPGAFMQVTPGEYEVAVVNRNGTSNRLSFTVVSEETGILLPNITSLSPVAGSTGTSVIISGTGLNRLTQKINFGSLEITPDQNYKMINRLLFVVPTTLNDCTGSNCLAVFQPTPLGIYNVSVTSNKIGASNALQYQVTGNGSANNF